ncbi:beta-amyrin 28-monooxygenase-like [Magnolia sinica]|uniref:beta-amyrin 28-monooxygenase-like n=1 Tax=Magnolia sinica TaxID=86752 RepID=UPI002658F0D5|nr:beta-amyrin 28-monooxygenase-like [Magnolia sinica]
MNSLLNVNADKWVKAIGEWLLLNGFLGLLFLIILGFGCLRLFQPRTKKLLPPGTYGWPLIGETMRSWKSTKPGEFIEKRREKYHHQIFKTSLFGHKMAVMCGPAANKFLFSNEKKLVVTWWPRSVQNIFPSSILTDAGAHAHKLVTSFLRPEALRRYVGLIDGLAQCHFKDEWHGEREVKAFHLIDVYTFMLACRLFAGIEDNPDCISTLAHEFHLLVRGVLQVPLRLPGTRYHRAMKAADEIRKVLGNVVIERRRRAAASSMQDMMSYLLVTPDDKGRLMTEKEILDNMLLLLFAGHDTTTSAITLLVKFLAENSQVHDHVFKEQMEIAKCKGEGEGLNWEDIQKMRFSWNVASEAMRLCPPVGGAFREAISEFTYAGFTIPKGWKIHWRPYTTHSNPNCFVDPEKFDPWRFDRDIPGSFTFVPFGGGPRMCPGKELARLEILVFLHNLVKRFKWESVFPNKEIELDPMPLLRQGLPIRLQPHLTCPSTNNIPAN